MKKFVRPFVAILFVGAVQFILHACEDKDDNEPRPVITDFYPKSGVVGEVVYIIGNNFVPPVTPSPDPIPNTATVKFNGMLAVSGSVYQDSIGKQRISALVSSGTTSGKFTVETNGFVASSPGEFTVITPVYVPNTVVTTFARCGGRGIALEANGNLYVSDWDMFKIYKITPDGTVSTFLHKPDLHFNFGIAVDAQGNVYAAADHTIIKVAPDGSVSTLAGSTAGFADGQGANAQFNFPWGIAVDVNGNVYVTDWFNYKIRKVAPDGTVTTLAGSTAGYDDGQGVNAKFFNLQGITIDASGNLFVADYTKIRKITPAGNVTTVAGSTEGYYDALGSSAQFKSPYGVALDAMGNIYVCDSYNFVIRKLSPGGNVTTLAGGPVGFSDGQGVNARFNIPRGVVVDDSGAIYVADTDNGRVRKIVIN